MGKDTLFIDITVAQLTIQNRKQQPLWIKNQARRVSSRRSLFFVSRQQKYCSDAS